MRTSNTNTAGGLTIPAFFLVVSIFLSSCSQKVNFIRSAVVPAADGRVKIDKDGNNNYSIDVFVENLAPPSKLNPPKEVYVVWMETERNGTQNLGQLVTSSGLFSNALEASLKTVTPYKPIRIVVTAEDETDLQSPGFQTVIMTKKF